MYENIAWALLPDHFHLLIDPKGNDLSVLMKKVKLSFSANYRKFKSIKSGKIWQNRFWDHIIRNEEDYNNHLNYIHYNPVEAGLVTRPEDYLYSSARDYAYEQGLIKVVLI